MGVFSRQFTKKEKILIVVLIIIILAFVYYLAVDQPVREGMTAAQSSETELDSELMIVNSQVEALEKKQSELDKATSGDDVTYVASYNNEQAELNFLNTVLSNAKSYNITVGEVTRDGDAVRRPISINYKTSTYKQAMTLLDNIKNCDLRCLITDINVTGNNTSIKKSDETSVVLSITFYETMVDGVADAGLPEEETEEVTTEDETSYY